MTALTAPNITRYSLENIIQNEANVNHQHYKLTSSNCSVITSHYESWTCALRSFGTSFHLKLLPTSTDYKQQTSEAHMSSKLNFTCSPGGPWMSGTWRRETWAHPWTAIYLQKHPALYLAHNRQAFGTWLYIFIHMLLSNTVMQQPPWHIGASNAFQCYHWLHMLLYKPKDFDFADA